MKAFAIVLLILIVGALAIVMVNDFTRLAKCQEAGGIYHRSQCLDPGSLIKV
jgi:hypothetical protein